MCTYWQGRLIKMKGTAEYNEIMRSQLTLGLWLSWLTIYSAVKTIRNKVESYDTIENSIRSCECFVGTVSITLTRSMAPRASVTLALWRITLPPAASRSDGGMAYEHGQFRGLSHPLASTLIIPNGTRNAFQLENKSPNDAAQKRIQITQYIINILNNYSCL